MMKWKVWLVVSAFLFPAAASATLVTSETFAPSATIDFSQFTGGNQYTGTNGPIQVGGLVGVDVQFTSVNSAGWLSNYDGWGFNANGNWTAAHNGYASVNSSTDPITFTFAAPVSAVGGLMNYSPQYGPVTIEALGAGNVVLESYDLKIDAPISASGNDGGAFRGIVRDSADIVAFRITGGYAGIDDFAFTSVLQVPATSPFTLAAIAAFLALAGLFALRTR